MNGVEKGESVDLKQFKICRSKTKGVSLEKTDELNFIDFELFGQLIDKDFLGLFEELFGALDNPDKKTENRNNINNFQNTFTQTNDFMKNWYRQTASHVL